MGGQTSREPKKGAPPEAGAIKNEAAALVETLTRVGQAGTLSETHERRLAQSFSRIEAQAASLHAQTDGQKSPLVAAKLEETGKVFLNIEWDISEIKTAAPPHWDNVYSLINRIQTFMDSWGDFSQLETQTAERLEPAQKKPQPEGGNPAAMQQIAKLEQKLQMVDQKIKMLPEGYTFTNTL